MGELDLVDATRPAVGVAATVTAAAGAPHKVLALIDAAEAADAVVARLIADLALGSRQLDVVLLNVQPRPDAGQTRGLFKEAIQSRLRDVGLACLAPAARALSNAGVAYRCRIELGESVATALACACDENCELIIVGCRLRRPNWRILETLRLAERSVAAALVERADAPVLVVKA